ncbi:hypothetical protein TNCV_3475631 [Trichonephila clavipes]|nr:hypothetical protein TNCV_3475631 [Trichonephila clavipes]
MGPKCKPRSVNNESTSSDSCEINMERFAYDVFVSIFIRLGVTDFPPFNRDKNYYENFFVLNAVSSEVLWYQFYYRDEFIEAFKILSSRHSFSNMEEFTKVVYDRLKECDPDTAKDTSSIALALFAVHAELYLYFQSQNITVDFLEMPRSWYKFYTEDISKSMKHDISKITENYFTLRVVEWMRAIVSYFRSEYFMPYGAKEGYSKIFRLVDEKFEKGISDSDEIINPQLIERIAKSVLSEEAAKKLPASKGQGIPPPQSADQTASRPRRRKPSSLSYCQWKREREISKRLLKQSAEAPERQKVARNQPERSVEEELNELRLGE